MQITSAVGQPTLLSKVSNKPNTPASNSARLAEPEADEKIAQDQSRNKQTQSAIIFDQQAIALFEESQASQLSQTKSAASGSSSADQDQPSAKNETAVASYQAISNQAQRESVQQLFGVDLFA